MAEQLRVNNRGGLLQVTPGRWRHLEGVFDRFIFVLLKYDHQMRLSDLKDHITLIHFKPFKRTFTMGIITLSNIRLRLKRLRKLLLFGFLRVERRCLNRLTYVHGSKERARRN